MSNCAMSNETELDWLARNHHTWPPKADVVVSIGWKCMKAGEPDYVRVNLGKEITKEQWLARRAELQSKPSWKEAPEWANYLAIDGDSVWYWHEMDPKTVAGCEYWMSRGQSDIACRGELLGDWRDTLEQRPEEFQSFTSIEDNQERAMKQNNGWHELGELPPVGVVCEAYIDYPPQWVEAEIVAHKDGFAIGWCKSVMKGCHGDKASEFRPIRNDRDELADLIESHGQMSALIVADAILAAGFKRGGA